MNREIYQKLYDFELEQRNSIASATNIPIVALTVLGGGLSSMVIGFKYSDNTSSYLFIATAVFTILSIAYSLYLVIRSFLGYSYEKIPPAKAMSAHLNELTSWHLRQGVSTEKALELAKIDFDQYLDERFSDAAENNSENNLARGSYLHDATIAVATSFVLLAITSLFYIYQKVSQPNEIHNVNIINELRLINKEKVMSDTKENGSSTNGESGDSDQKDAPAPAPAPAAPQKSADPKPAGPGNIVFKGNIKSTNISADTIVGGEADAQAESGD